MIDSEILLRIYKVVTKPVTHKYAPIRKHYNIHTFG